MTAKTADQQVKEALMSANNHVAKILPLIETFPPKAVDEVVAYIEKAIGVVSGTFPKVKV